MIAIKTALLVGVLFLTKNNQLLINEIALHSYNNGHHTIDDYYMSQF